MIGEKTFYLEDILVKYKNNNTYSSITNNSNLFSVHFNIKKLKYDILNIC